MKRVLIIDALTLVEEKLWSQRRAEGNASSQLTPNYKYAQSRAIAKILIGFETLVK